MKKLIGSINIFQGLVNATLKIDSNRLSIASTGARIFSVPDFWVLRTSRLVQENDARQRFGNGEHEDFCDGSEPNEDIESPPPGLLQLEKSRDDGTNHRV